MYILFSLIFVPLINYSKLKNANFLEKVTNILVGSKDVEGVFPSIGFVLSHPDDESMFFLPTLKVLKELAPLNSGAEVKFNLLYLSNGDLEGKGSEREDELKSVCTTHGYTCSVLNDPYLLDGPTYWDPNLVIPHLRRFISSNNVSILFTFDSKGVSDHPNHKSTHESVKLIKSEFPNLNVFYLNSLDVVSKYLGPLSIYHTFLNKNSVITPSSLTFYLNMRTHKTQFRKHIPLWALFSSYCYLNTYSTE